MSDNNLKIGGLYSLSPVLGFVGNPPIYDYSALENHFDSGNAIVWKLTLNTFKDDNWFLYLKTHNFNVKRPQNLREFHVFLKNGQRLCVFPPECNYTLIDVSQ